MRQSREKEPLIVAKRKVNVQKLNYLISMAVDNLRKKYNSTTD